MIVLVHGKVDGFLQEFTIVNPTNLVFNEAKAKGELEGPSGNKLMVPCNIIHFPNGMQLPVEESLKELTRLFEGGSDTNDTNDTKE